MLIAVPRMASRRRLAILGALCASVLLARARAAWAGDDDVANAQVLFDEGRKLMAKRDYLAACPKLAESQRLSPAIGTEFNLGDCWEHLGRIASAWGAFLEVADMTHRRGEGEREQAARARAASLEPRLGRLVVDVPPSHRVADLEVRRDGEVVRPELWGVAVPVDGGDHRIEARAPGRRAWTSAVRTSDGQSASIAVPELAAAPVVVEAHGGAGADPVLPRAGAGAAAGAATAPHDTGTAGSPDHTAAYIAFGGAIVAAGVGALGLVQHDAKVNAYNTDSTCPGINSNLPQPQQCADDISASSSWNTVAIVGFVTSGIAFVGGVTLWLLAPRPGASATSSGPSVGCSPGPSALLCAGTF